MTMRESVVLVGAGSAMFTRGLVAGTRIEV